MAGSVFGVAAALVFLLFLVWSIFWKGLALWKAARLSHKGWFIALLIINTAGILDILYIYIFSKKRRHHEPESHTPHTHGPHSPVHHSPSAKPGPPSHHHLNPKVEHGEPPEKKYHIGPADETARPSENS